MEFVWETNGSTGRKRKRNRQDKFAYLRSEANARGAPCEECHRRKKRCNHKDHTGSDVGQPEEGTPRSSASASPVRVGDYHPESILTELSAAFEGGKVSQPETADGHIENRPQRARFRLSRTAPDSSFEKRQNEWWHYHRQRPSVTLPDHQREYLETAGAFLVLPKSTTDILIPTYVSVIDGLVPVVDGAQVLRDYNNGQASRYLIRAMCLVICKTEQAAPFLKLREDDPVLAPLVFAKSLYEGLYAAAQAELERDRIVQIQILSLLHLYNDGLAGVERASAHLSQAIHDSWFISLHYNVAGNPIQNRCDMLWWSLRCFDKLNKFIVGAPFMISDGDIQISRPVAGDSYQSQTLTVLMNLGDLLVTVEEIVYNPHNTQDVGGVEDFPPFSELTKQVRFHEFQKAHQNYLEIWYHVAAMLSCRSSLPGTTPYQRRLRSAHRIQDMMSHGRHAYLPPLPLIPYAMAMSLTVKYRDLRENKIDLEKDREDLKARLEILEALGECWTTAKIMARLAKKVFKILRRKGTKTQQVSMQKDVGRQAKGRRRNSEKQKSVGTNISTTENYAVQNGAVPSNEHGSHSHWIPGQEEQPEGVYSVGTGESGQDLPESSNWESVEQSYNWPAADMDFNFEPDPFYDLSNFGMGNVFRDLSGWGVSPNFSDGTNSVGT